MIRLYLSSNETNFRFILILLTLFQHHRVYFHLLIMCEFHLLQWGIWHLFPPGPYLETSDSARCRIHFLCNSSTHVIRNLSLSLILPFFCPLPTEGESFICCQGSCWVSSFALLLKLIIIFSLWLPSSGSSVAPNNGYLIPFFLQLILPQSLR